MIIERIRQKYAQNRIDYRRKVAQVIGWIVLVLASPVFMLIDAVRPSSSRKILLAYLWFMVIFLCLTAVCYWSNDRIVSKLQSLLGRFFYPQEEAVALNKDTAELVNRYSVMFNINPQLINAIIQVESNNNPNARSPKGAAGLMQIMPAVWRQYNPHSRCDGRHLPGKVDHGTDCIYSVEANIRTGVRHLRFLIDYFHGEIGMAIEAYNAGIVNVDLDRNRPKFKETRDYLHRIATVMAPATTPSITRRLSMATRSKVLVRRMLIISQMLWGILIFWLFKRVL
ncbi:MAG TPA: lytic transglycosylase domain-containing protein [Firmicutes bacterium]|nr:lytic transglycosylase domain-containing protein [Bacillota bacterium]